MPEISQELIQALSDRFDEECQHRHEMGREKYGPVKFLEVNAFQEAMDEVADLANYARYAWIKLALLAEFDPSTGSNTVRTHVEIDHPTDNKNSSPYNTGFFNPYRRQR